MEAALAWNSSIGQKPINESRQMASKIKVVKIRQYTVFARGVVCFFFQIKEDGNNVSFLFAKSITNVINKMNQMIFSATVFP